MVGLKYYDAIVAARKEKRRNPAVFDFDTLGKDTWLQRAKTRIGAVLIPLGLALFRAVWPNPRFGRLIIVTRESDVRDVLARPDLFEVPYALEMTDLAGGENFVLGLEGPPHDAQAAIIRQVVRTEDEALVARYGRDYSELLIAASGGRIDVCKDLLTRVAAETCCRYFGLQVEDKDAFAEWTMSLSNLLFADPFGSKAARALALAGAERIRTVIHRSIAATRDAPRDDTVLGRLLVLQRTEPLLTDARICAILVGLSVGFVPTNTLAAGKMLAALLKRPDALADAAEKARAGDLAGLRRVLLEAARLNPALSPGQWRYARAPGVIAAGTRRERRVDQGCVLLVATASALRDRRAVENPSKFDPDRPPVASELLFGTGAHACLGRTVAIAQIEQVFHVLLKQRDLRPVHGWYGRMGSAGPFPRRLDMRFRPVRAAATQTMVTVCAPVRPGADLAALQGLLKAFGNPANPDIRAALDKTGAVHFASLVLMDAGPEGKPAPHILLDLDADGSLDDAIRHVSTALRDWLAPVFAHVEARGAALEDVLHEHALTLRQRPWGAIGLNFPGTGDFAVPDIERQAELAAFSRDMLDRFFRHHIGHNNRALRALNFVRDAIVGDDRAKRALDANRSFAGARRSDLGEALERGSRFADMLILPSRRQLAVSQWRDRTKTEAVASFLQSPSFGKFLLAWGVFNLVAISIAFVALGHGWRSVPGRLVVAIASGFTATTLALGLLAGGFVAMLLWRESRDVSDDRDPDIARVEAIAASENPPGFRQNQFTAVTALKPGWFRKLTLALSLWGVRELIAHSYRPGFVLNMGTIQYAKWFRIPGRDTLIFQANYDGSWESYLEDFVTKAHEGQTAVWSNGVGFPRTRLLTRGGAQDGDRFKRWVRRQQVLAPFWYARFPQLTGDGIRNNALIHDGLARAFTDDAARAWLQCFGSAQRPQGAIETDEVQSLVFRGFGRLQFGACALLRLPGDRASRSAWLRALTSPDGDVPAVTFGDHPQQNGGGDAEAAFAAFSPSGVRALFDGQAQADGALASFPTAFQLGMGKRARSLGDTGPSDPASWSWTDAAPANGPPVADAALIVFAGTPERCRAMVAAHVAGLGGVIDMVEMAPAERGMGYEHFGFKDGISQPVIRGTERHAKGAAARDLAEPGEFILGYRSNPGYFPPTPSVAAETDLAGILPTAPDRDPTAFPTFGQDANARRDLGRNGSFMAIRQLVQHVDAFKAFTTAKADDLKKLDGFADLVGEAIDADWVGSKLMGRQPDGRPLVGPYAGKSAVGTTRVRTKMNDFGYAEEDPQGMRCPFGAHVRRANPRDQLGFEDPTQQVITNRHRLIRRGRPYMRADGETGREEKGLLFMGLCADLERQFEFIQQTWINSPNFHGLTNEPDPIVGGGREANASLFTLPTASGPVTIRNLPSFVDAKAGGYFFLPSRSALAYFASL